MPFKKGRPRVPFSVTQPATQISSPTLRPTLATPPPPQSSHLVLIGQTSWFEPHVARKTRGRSEKQIVTRTVLGHWLV